jgi:hypothetical protein
MVVALAALVVAVGGVAFATIPGPDGRLHACYQRSNGNLRLVESGGDCRSSESAVSWNQSGVTGPTGPRGATGPKGDPGPPGAGTAADEESAEASTTSESYVDLGGPEVTIDVPTAGLIGVGLRAEGKPLGKAVIFPVDPSGGGPISPPCAELALHEATDFGSPRVLTQFCNFDRDSAESDYKSVGTAGGVYWTKLEATPGEHTYSLLYRLVCPGRPSCSAGDRAFFRNRKLWVRPGG